MNLKAIGSILKKINEKQFYHTSKFNDVEKKALSLLFKFGNEIFVYDIFRMVTIHPSSNELFKGETVIYLFNICISGISSDIENVKIISLRTLINLFSIESGRTFLANKRQELLDSISVFIDSTNKNIKSSLSILLFNVSIIFYDKVDNEATVQIISLINECLSVVTQDDDIKNINNLLISIGNMIHLSTEKLNISRDLDILSTINSLSINSNDAIYKEILAYLCSALK